MTNPSRPAPPPPTSSQIQSVIQQSNKSSIKHATPPGSTTFPINHNTSGNNYISREVVSKCSSPSHSSTKSITPYFTTTKWNGSNIDAAASFIQNKNKSATGAISYFNKRIPPPRPPPPRLLVYGSGNSNGALKSSGTPQSVNVLSNLFGRSKNFNRSNNLNRKIITSQSKPKGSLQIFSNENNTYNSTTNLSTYSSFPGQINIHSNLLESTSASSGENSKCQLINFDSPPTSPTFTQISYSDCVSVESLSSDSNFSSLNNDSKSQAGNGFEDDFLTSDKTLRDPWEVISNPPFLNNKIRNSSIRLDFGISQRNDMTVKTMQSSAGTIVYPVRNINVINKVETENHLCNGKSLLPPYPTLAVPTIIRPNKGFAPKPPIPKLNTNPQYETQYNQPTRNSVFVENPPMPTCSPPPPPSIIYEDDNYKDDARYDFAYGIALYNFDGGENGDLTFRQNDHIHLISKLNNEWFIGRTKNGCEGILPSNYINIIVPLKGVHQMKKKGEYENQSTITSEGVNKHKIKVLYNFKAEQSDDLTIYENDVVNVMYKINENWLFGSVHNRLGQFPANFIEYIPPDLPIKMP